MKVTLFGIVIDFKLVQLAKADNPMLFTLDGIVTDVKFVQF